MSDLNPNNSIGRDEMKPLLGDQIPDVVETTLQRCCVDTIRLHASFNPMMVCPDCKQIIKCFKEEKPYRNYLKFCKSRHRKVGVSRLSDMQVVVYRSFGKLS